MGLLKTTKPSWAYDTPVDPLDPYIVEPPLVKRMIGWILGERPPRQWFNWLQYQNKTWIDILESFDDFHLSSNLFSDAQVAWNSTTGAITFTADIAFSFLLNGTWVTNSIAAASSPLTLTDGQALVFVPSETTAALTFVADYEDLEAGKYTIVTAASMTENADFHEVVLMKRVGTSLEIPLAKMRVNGSRSFWLSGFINHDHTNANNGGQLDHGSALTGLGDDDHTQYVLANGTRAFSAVVSGVTPTADTHLATKGYVDGLIPSMTHVTYDNVAETISSVWDFTVGAQLDLIRISDNDIYERDTNGDNGTIYLNRIGHNGTTDHFRDTAIGDGKGTNLFYVDGNDALNHAKISALCSFNYQSSHTDQVTSSFAPYNLGNGLPSAVTRRTGQFYTLFLTGTTDTAGDFAYTLDANLEIFHISIWSKNEDNKWHNNTVFDVTDITYDPTTGILEGNLQTEQNATQFRMMLILRNAS